MINDPCHAFRAPAAAFAWRFAPVVRVSLSWSAWSAVPSGVEAGAETTHPPQGGCLGVDELKRFRNSSNHLRVALARDHHAMLRARSVEAVYGSAAQRRRKGLVAQWMMNSWDLWKGLAAGVGRMFHSSTVYSLDACFGRRRICGADNHDKTRR